MRQLCTNRRKVIQGALGAAAGAACAQGLVGTALAAAAGSSAAGGPIATTRLAGNVHVLTGAGANVLALCGGGGGAVLIDGGLEPHSAALLEAVAALPDSGDVHTLFNTCWHPEQTCSNRTLGEAGARIVAHENTRLWLTTDITRPWEPERTFPPLPTAAQPNDTFYTTGAIEADAGRIEYGYLRQAHTDGNIYVFFPGANVLAIGGVIRGDGWAEIDWWTGGWINGLVNALATLREIANEDTIVVPAAGPVLGYADLERQHEMYATISPRLRNLMYSGRGPDEAVAAEPAREYAAEMGDPDGFIRRAFESMWGHFTPDA
jgi:glyoxylase-like metal-dependent hydrolase (beta-lactamase superfamily II)